MDDGQGRRPLSRAEQERVLDKAWRLQDEKEERRRGEEELGRLAAAGEELGLDPAHLKQAEALVRMEIEGQAARRKNRRTAWVAGGLIALGAAAMGGVHLLPRLRGAVTGAKAGAAPFDAPFVASDYRLEVSPGSAGQVRFEGGVATVTVERFAPQPDGRYWINLESDGHPDWTGLRTVTFSVRGEGLPAVRLYLENPTERWRGPIVPVTSTWQTHALPLGVFEHQQKEGGWKVTADASPSTVKTISFKLGWFVNDAAARGSVELKGLHAE